MATIESDKKHRDLVDTICGVVAEYFGEHSIPFEGPYYSVMVGEMTERCEYLGLTGDDVGSIKEWLLFDPTPWLEYTKARYGKGG